MALILLVVFALVFTVAALLVSAVGSGAASRDRFQAALAAALNRPELAAAVETVDVRKKNSLSSIAWLHSLLVRMDAAVRLQLMLDQAELAWTPSRLLLSAAAAWVISAYALHLKMDLGAAALLWSLPLGAAPLE